MARTPQRFAYKQLLIENKNGGAVHIDVMDGSFVPNYTLGTDFVKALKKNSKHQKLNKQEEELLITINKLKISTSKSKKTAFKDFFFNLVLVLLISFCNSLLYAIVVDTHTNFDTWILVLVFLFTHLVILFIFKVLNDRRTIKRKEIKENCK